MTAYQELRDNLPPDLKKTLSGIRQYAESSLDYLDQRRQIFDAVRDRDERRQQLAAIRESVEQLSIALFCHATYRKFVVGDATIKETVATFEDLRVSEVQIGSLTLSRRSDFYDLGARLARGLLDAIRDETLRRQIVNNASWHEIVALYRDERGVV
jgi:hypothetical protein